MPLLESTKDALLKVGTSTLTGILHRRNLRNMFMQDVNPLRITQPRMVGLAFTMRFIPSREDKAGANAPNGGQTQVQAMEECPPGHVLVIDSRGDARAASAGDLYIGRLMARGCSGIVTDGGLRDSEGILKTGLPAYLRRPTSPPSPIVHQPIDLNLPIGCGGVAVYPGDVIVGDCDGVVVSPPILPMRSRRRLWLPRCTTNSPKGKSHADGRCRVCFRTSRPKPRRTLKLGSSSARRGVRSPNLKPMRESTRLWPSLFDEQARR
jgi:regulator of RNase E activity RraA